MKVIIPVAGRGTRLRPHTDQIQKALLPLAGKPLLDHIVENLLAQGFDRLSFIVGHFGDQISDHLKKYRGQFEIVYQTEQLGLGHAVLQGLQDTDQPLLVYLGDAVYDYPLPKLRTLVENGIAVQPVADPERFGVVALEGDRITGFHEKVADPPTNLAIIGLYYFQQEQRLKQALEYLLENDHRTNGEYQLTDALTVMLNWGEPFRVIRGAVWYDAGIPETYLRSNRLLLRSDHQDFPGVEFREPVHVGPGCRISNSVIGPHVTIMDDCRIDNCELTDCVVLAGSRLKDKNIRSRITAGDGSEYC
ncbi:MAG: sugar phosphate nucleotidyltransferase [Candidatus Neomarinimicrobiota bacterium]